MPVPPSPPLDQSISPGQFDHIADHEAIADALNNDTASLAGAQSISGVKTFVPGALIDAGSQIVDVRAYGAVAGGGDAQSEIQDALDSTPRGIVLIPAGFTFGLASPLILPATPTVLRVEGSLVAIAAMTTMIDSTTGITGGGLLGGSGGGLDGSGVIDCNDLADEGVRVRRFEDYPIGPVQIKDYNTIGLALGDTALATSYEAIVRGTRIWRTRAAPVPAGSKALHVESTVSDSHFTDVIVNGAETGVRVDGTANKFVAVHAWTHPASGRLLTAFDDNGNRNRWVVCDADGADVYGFRCRQFNTHIVEAHCQTIPSSPDDVAIGIYFDQADPFATILGAHFAGYDGSHRMAQDISVASLASMTILGTTTTGFVTTAAGQCLRGLKGTLTAEDIIIGSNTDTSATLQLNGAAGFARNIQIYSGGVLRWIIRVTNDAESGGNVGSDLQILGRADDGSALTTIFQAKRGGNWAFNGVNPTVSRPAVGAAATDPATTQTLANALRTALINLGIVQT